MKTPAAELTHLTLKLDPKTNDLLENARKETDRSKRIEAERRLIDHLQRYPTYNSYNEEQG